MEPFLSGEDFTNLRDSAQEARSMYSVSVLVKRFSSFTGGNTALGKAPTRVDVSIPTIARVFNLSQKDILSSGGIYQLGDIKTHTLIDIVGFNSPTSNQTQGDKIAYDANNYIVVGKPRRVYAAGGRVYTEAYWSKIQ